MAITDTSPLAQVTGVTPYEKYIDPYRKPMQESLQAKTELSGLQQGMETQRTQEKLQKTGSVEDEFAKRSSEASEREQKKRVSEEMEKPFIPTQESAKDMASLFSLINVVGFALGSGGKRNAQAAMSAMNGMLEGHQKGRDDVYKREKSNFDTNLKQLKMRYDTLDNQLKDALNTYKTDKEAGLRKAEMAYAEAGANFYKQYQDKFGLAGMYEYHKQAYDSANKMFTELKREEDRAERLRLQSESAKRAEKQFELSERRLGLAEKRAETKGTEKPPTRKETLPLIQGIRSVEKLQEDIRDPEIRTGLTAKAAPLLEKIASLGDKKDFEQAVNQTLTGTDKTTVFLKNALLNSYAIERAASGGGRLTVAMMRQAGPVLDPTNYTPQAYAQILEDRRKEFYENLQDYGFTPQQIRESTAPRAYSPFGGGAPKPSDKQMPTGDKLKAYAATHFDGNEESAKQYLKSQGYQ